MSVTESKKKPHLSISQISMYTRCGEQHRRRYGLGEIIPPGVSLICGSGTHKGIETTLTRKIETGALATDEEVGDAARDCVVKAFAGGEFLLSEDEKFEGADKVKASSTEIDTCRR